MTVAFEVAIGPGNEPGLCHVDVLRSPAGQTSAQVRLDVDRWSDGRQGFQAAVLASGVLVRRVLTEHEQIIRDVGQELFVALLGTGEVGALYRATLAVAADTGEQLSILLSIDNPALASLPWEAMYDDAAGTYVGLRHQLIRYIPAALSTAPLAFRPPLRILGVISSPRGLPSLDVDSERETLNRALAGHVDEGLIEITWLSSATWEQLHDLLLSQRWEVLHFIGHGDFDAVRNRGVLALSTADGRVDLVEARRFADLFRQADPAPRLVVLNTCSGAVAGSDDFFASSAAALVRAGINAVAAMQYAISDVASRAFTAGFYSAIARGRGVDEAISSGRISIRGSSNRTMEWITPVLYLRGSGLIFDVETPRGSTNYSRIPARLAWVLHGHTNSVYGVAFRSDNKFLATCGGDGTARLWSVDGGEPVAQVGDGSSILFGLCFQPA